MSITTNAELVTAVGDYLARSDLTSYIPDFIIGGESRFTYGSGVPGDPFYCPPLRIRAMETASDVTVTSGSGSLPTGFLQARRVYWSGSPNIKVEQVSPEDYYSKWYGSTTSSPPSVYIIEDDSIIVGPKASGTLKVLHYKKFDPIATAAPVTWLLTNHPHVYVYAALMEAAPFIRNDPRIPLWASMLRSAVQGLNHADQRDRWGGTALNVRTDVGNQ